MKGGKKERKEFLYRARNGDYDAIIIKHSTFENLGVLENSAKQMLYEEVSTLKQIKTIEESASKQQIKASELIKWIDRKIRRLKAKLYKLTTKKISADREINFEDLGVDCLIVDEAQEFKNLPIDTISDT